MFSSESALQEVDIYKIQERITKSLNSVVYKAINTKDDSIVVIKEIPLQDLSQNTIKNMKMNLKILKYLQHDNLVKYLDNIQTETHLYVIQEYIPSLINKETVWSEEIAALFTRQILKALEYLHSHHIIHRDIQRAHLLSPDARQVKLINPTPARFGVPQDSDILDSCMYWMAPEVLKGEPVCSGSDIWSLGCTIIELFTGLPPYYGLKPMEFAMKLIGDDEVLLPETISKDCGDFLRKCLNKDVKQRAKVGELLEHPWVCNEKVEKEMEKFGIVYEKSQINEDERED